VSEIEHIGMVAADTFTWSPSMGCYRWNHEKIGAAVLAHLAERGMVVLGPDGEPLDVRPLVRTVMRSARRERGRFTDIATWLMNTEGYEPPLADACLAAAEVEE
jgi:hypothetical protein